MNLMKFNLLVMTVLIESATASAQNTNRLIAFEDVHVIPMDKNHVLSHQTVLVQDGKIKEMGDVSKVVIPDRAIRINGKGAFLMPGMVDMHAHLPKGEAGEINLNDYLTLNIIRGVTSVRSMRGDPSHLALQDSIQKNLRFGPNLFLGSPVLPKNNELDAQKAQVLIEQYKKQNYQFIKYLYPLRPSLYDSVMEIARSQGIPVAGHCPKAGLESAINAGQASVEHLEPFLQEYKKDPVKFRQLMIRMAEKNVASCLDLQWYYIFWYQLSIDQLKQNEGAKYLPSALVTGWVADFEEEYASNLKKGESYQKEKDSLRKDLLIASKMLKVMQESGVRLLLSAGDGEFVIPGYSYMDECRNFVGAGISPYETLRSGTANAAAYFGESNLWGTIGNGKRADLILLDENPLNNIENLGKIKGVMVRGTWYSRADLDQLQSKMSSGKQPK
jgi:imidazolonepropionase-like amidohydrolase